MFINTLLLKFCKQLLIKLYYCIPIYSYYWTLGFILYRFFLFNRSRWRWTRYVSIEYKHHGPLTRCVKLRVAHAPGMPGFPRHCGLAIPTWHASRHARHTRAVMHAGIANYRLPLKSVAAKTFPAFPAHAQPAILRIWQEAHGIETFPHYWPSVQGILRFPLKRAILSPSDISFVDRLNKVLKKQPIWRLRGICLNIQVTFL